MSVQLVSPYKHEMKLRAKLAELRAKHGVPTCAEDRECKTKAPNCRCYYCVSRELQELMIEKWVNGT